MIGVVNDTGRLRLIALEVSLLVVTSVALEAATAAVCSLNSRDMLVRLSKTLHDTSTRRTLLPDGNDHVRTLTVFSQNMEYAATNLEVFLVKFPKAASSVLALFVIIIASNPIIAVLTALLTPAALLLPAWVNSRAQPFLQREVDLSGKALDEIQPFFNFFRTTGGVLLERAAGQIALRMHDHHMNQASKWFFWNLSFNVGSFFNLALLSSILIFGGYSVLNDTMQPSALFSLFLAVSLILPRFNDIFDSYFYLTAAGHHAVIVEERLRHACPAPETGMPAAPARLEVEIDRFERAGHVILRDLKLEFRPGSLYLITGESGCGKSTLASIIAGWETRFTGRVRLIWSDGEESVRPLGHVVCIGQEHHFPEHISLEEALLYQNDPAADAVAEPHRLLDAMLPGTSATASVPVASINSEFSGGEKQRLHVIQALLAPQKIRVFDEPTASLDARSAAVVKATLSEVPSDEIRIVITHDPTWPVAPDRVLTLTKTTHA